MLGEEILNWRFRKRDQAGTGRE